MEQFQFTVRRGTPVSDKSASGKIYNGHALSSPKYSDVDSCDYIFGAFPVELDNGGNTFFTEEYRKDNPSERVISHDECWQDCLGDDGTGLYEELASRAGLKIEDFDF